MIVSLREKWEFTEERRSQMCARRDAAWAQGRRVEWVPDMRGKESPSEVRQKCM